MKRKIEVRRRVVCMVGRSLYFLGLTVLIPFFPLIMSPGILQYIKNGSMFVGIVFIASGVIILREVESPRGVLFSLGVFTMMPSFLALFYAIVGPELVQRWISYFGPASPYIKIWLEFSLPRAISIAIVYFLLGFALFLSSRFWPKR